MCKPIRYGVLSAYRASDKTTSGGAGVSPTAMKSIHLSICLATLAVASSSPVLRAQDATRPDPALGTPIVVPEGFVVLDGKTYFVRSGQASAVSQTTAETARRNGIANLDTLPTTLKAGTMMTLDGKIVPIPSGVVFSKQVNPDPVGDERALERAISSQNTTPLAPAATSGVAASGNGTGNATLGGSAAVGTNVPGSTSNPRRSATAGGGTLDNTLPSGEVVVNGAPQAGNTNGANGN
ncbi:MAG: hypothetical protein JWO89_1952, partial [Verrucomicrobiaceae bacterium]|nr:hypothetical protein [Verrucomicrobiaceae bacterium]